MIRRCTLHPRRVGRGQHGHDVPHTDPPLPGILPDRPPMGRQIRTRGQRGHLPTFARRIRTGRPGSMQMVEVVEVQEPQLFIRVPHHTGTAVVRRVIGIGAVGSVVGHGENSAVLTIGVRQVRQFDVGTADLLGHGTADAGHGIVVRVEQVELAIRVLAVRVLHHGWISERPMSAGWPLRILVRTVLPILGLFENLPGGDHVQRQSAFHVRQIHTLQIVVQRLQRIESVRRPQPGQRQGSQAAAGQPVAA